MTNVQLYGWCYLTAGTVLWLLVQRGRFNRRGLGGLQHFKGFWIALLALITECMALFVAWGMLAFGTFLLIIEWFNGN